jgi:hypothetical protein
MKPCSSTWIWGIWWPVYWDPHWPSDFLLQHRATLPELIWKHQYPSFPWSNPKPITYKNWGYLVPTTVWFNSEHFVLSFRCSWKDRSNSLVNRSIMRHLLISFLSLIYLLILLLVISGITSQINHMYSYP